MFPSSVSTVMQQMNDAEVVRRLEATRRRSERAAARREQSRARLMKARALKPGLRTESQPSMHTI